MHASLHSKCSPHSSFLGKSPYFLMDRLHPHYWNLVNRTLSPLFTEILYGKSPEYHLLPSFGFLCYINQSTSNKFQSRSRKYVFIGYLPLKEGGESMIHPQ